MSSNKILAKRWLHEVLMDNSANHLAAYESKGFIDWEGQSSRITAGAYRSSYLSALPDFTYHLDHAYNWGAFVLCRGYWRGTQVKPLYELGTVAGTVEGHRLDLFRCRDGRITEHWGTGINPALANRRGVADQAAPMASNGVVRRFVTECLGSRDANALGALLTVDAVGSDLTSLLSLLLVLANHPGVSIRVQHVLGDGNMTSALAMIELPPNRAPANESRQCPGVPLIVLCRMEGPLIDQIWVNYDDLELAQQLAARNHIGNSGEEPVRRRWYRR